LLEEIFQEGNSFIHRADPRGKVICAFLLAFFIADLTRLAPAGLAFMLGAVFVCAAKLPPGKVFRRLLVVNVFVAFLWVFLPFSVPGEVLFSVWKWRATAPGIQLAVLITLKCNAILLIIICFISTTPIPLLGSALTSLRLPRKLTLLMLISYRYIHVILSEYNRLLQAAKIRGFVPGNNLHTYRTYAYLLAMVLIKSYERGVRVYQAMLVRGFSGKFYSLRSLRFRPRDIVLLTGVSLFSIFLFWEDSHGMIPLLSIASLFRIQP